MSRFPNYPQPKQRASRRQLFLALAILLLVSIPALILLLGKSEDAPKTSAPVEQTFDKTQYSLDDPTSPWLVVNKQRPLNPLKYEPADLRTPDMNVESNTMQVNGQTATALDILAGAAATEGINLIVVSAFRSYDTQAMIYDSEVKGFGQAQADRESARPGHSEHQTGWAADLGAENGKCRIELCFADTPEGKWLARNAYKYGFIIRYAKDKESVTGYQYEPWHVRYIGKDLATEMHRTGVETLEEFFDLSAAPSY